jgi:hypothetical protein
MCQVIEIRVFKKAMLKPEPTRIFDVLVTWVELGPVVDRN